MWKPYTHTHTHTQSQLLKNPSCNHIITKRKNNMKSCKDPRTKAIKILAWRANISFNYLRKIKKMIKLMN